MFKYLITALYLLFIFVGCKTIEPIDNATQEEEAQVLASKLSEILNLSTSETCTNPSDWTYTAVGSKPCGGPWTFIAYSNNIDTSYFLNLVSQHLIAESAYNEKWNVVSDCSAPQEPSGVDCQDGLPIFLY